VGLWRAWESTKDRQALQTLCEYNMEDTWSLPFLAAWCHDLLAERLFKPAVLAGAAPLQPLRDFSQDRAESGPMMLRAVADALAAI